MKKRHPDKYLLTHVKCKTHMTIHQLEIAALPLYVSPRYFLVRLSDRSDSGNQDLTPADFENMVK